MSDSHGKIIWRVRSSDDQPQTSAFDALILATTHAEQAKLQQSRLVGMNIPFEGELPDVALTLIVRANTANAFLVSEVDILGADGTRRVYGRSGKPLAVFLYSKDGIVVTGLPAPTSDSAAPGT